MVYVYKRRIILCFVVQALVPIWQSVLLDKCSPQLSYLCVYIRHHNLTTSPERRMAAVDFHFALSSAFTLHLAVLHFVHFFMLFMRLFHDHHHPSGVIFCILLFFRHKKNSSFISFSWFIFFPHFSVCVLSVKKKKKLNFRSI